MNIDVESLEPGRYVVGVSGGVDSVVLLHLLQGRPELRLTVAHFDHGIRPDSSEDLRLVQALAARYGLPFVFQRAGLGAHASEDTARQARYDFLHRVRAAANAQAIVTAHHRDDVLETAIHNIVRGTGRRGLSSLKSTDIIRRPLLRVPKSDIRRFAADNQLVWREDSTNQDLGYRRNYIRHRVLNRFGAADKRALEQILQGAHGRNAEIDEILHDLLAAHTRNNKLERQWFIMLPHAVSNEVMAAWLRSQGVSDIDRRMIERLVHAAKTFPYGQKASVNHNNYLFIEKNCLALMTRER